MSRIGTAIFFGTLVFLVLGYAYWYAMSSPFKISSQDAKGLIREGKVDVILDVRTSLERQTLGFYPGSVHIPSADLEKVFTARYPAKGTRILAYCNSGQRARKAADILHSLGYTQVRYIVGTHTTLM